MRDIKFKITSWIMIVAGSLGFIPGYLPFRINKLIVAENAMFLGIAGFLIKNVWLQLFLVWCVVRETMAINTYSQLTLHMIVIALVAYQVLANTLNKARIKTVLDIICWTAIIQSVFVILQVFGIWFVTYPNVSNPETALVLFPNSLCPIYVFGKSVSYYYVGLLDSTNTAGALFAMCLPAFFRKRWVWCLPLIVSALVIVHAFGSIMAVIAAVIMLLILNFKKAYLWFILPAILAFTLYFIKFENIVGIIHADRLHVWWFHITHLIPKRPLIGWGLGQAELLWPIIKHEVAASARERWLHSHNEAITLTTELGLIGFGLVAGYFVSVFRKLKDHIIICGLVACIVSSLSIFSMHSAIGLLLIVYMALAQRSIDELKIQHN